MSARTGAGTVTAKSPADASAIEASFHEIADALQDALVAGEQYTAQLEAETTDFVRLNRGQVRQPGSVAQRYLTVRLVRGARHASHVLALAGDARADVAASRDAIVALRAVLADVDDDPHLLLPRDRHDSDATRGGPLPPSEQIVDEILDAARGLDLVGLYAAGPVCRGFANSLGQRNWHEATTFNLQWSLYHRADKAVRSAYAGFRWDRDAFARKMAAARETLALVARPSLELTPGNYRAYLAPAAVDEIAALLAWGGFSARALATKQSPLSRLAAGERLDPRISIAEDIGQGIAPPFQAEGFARPSRVPLIEHGALTGSLVSPRTAREFALAANGANGWEMPEALAMDGGGLDEATALQALGDGLWIGNLHYLNYSDRPNARITGMTRFATFKVEGGRIVAPIDVLRFDDSLFRLLGTHLVDLTREPELMLSGESYGSRRLTSTSVPGALVSGMAFTL